MTVCCKPAISGLVDVPSASYIIPRAVTFVDPQFVWFAWKKSCDSTTRLLAAKKMRYVINFLHNQKFQYRACRCFKPALRLMVPVGVR